MPRNKSEKRPVVLYRKTLFLDESSPRECVLLSYGELYCVSLQYKVDVDVYGAIVSPIMGELEDALVIFNHLDIGHFSFSYVELVDAGWVETRDHHRYPKRLIHAT